MNVHILLIRPFVLICLNLLSQKLTILIRTWQAVGLFVCPEWIYAGCLRKEKTDSERTFCYSDFAEIQFGGNMHFSVYPYPVKKTDCLQGFLPKILPFSQARLVQSWPGFFVSLDMLPDEWSIDMNMNLQRALYLEEVVRG